MAGKKIVLAVIPARGGSKSIPGKNIKEIAGRPLIAWTIDAAKNSPSIDKTIVSTDDKDIAGISKGLGADVPFMRPEELARDETATPPVIKHAVEWLIENEGYNPDIVVVLQPTSPMRTKDDIEGALALMEGADSVVSLCEAEHHPYWTKKIVDGRVEPFIEADREYTRRQDLPAAHRLNGAIYITRADLLLKNCSLLNGHVRPYIMLPERSIDIDTLHDFAIAEHLMGGRHG